MSASVRKVPGLGEIEALAAELTKRIREVIAELPEQTPTPLSRRVGVSRVTVSKLLNALARESELEAMQRLPGPESLRAIVRAAGREGADAGAVARAEDAIDEFARLISETFGTRPALDAAISTRSEGPRMRLEVEGRHQVYRGMRQVLGVQAETWLTSMIFTPSTVDPEAVRVTTVHGALGMRRLRADVHVQFTFGPPPRQGTEEASPAQWDIPLDEFCQNTPARLRSEVVGGLLVHSLDHGVLGKGAAVDMLTVGHSMRGSRRYAAPGRARGGVALYVDVPAKRLVCDAIVHRELFPNPDPQLKVYKPGARGPANPNDPVRDIDRLEVQERIEEFEAVEPALEVEQVPNYRPMLERVFAGINEDPRNYRVFRLAMAYPLYGFQYVMAFVAPPPPTQ